MPVYIPQAKAWGFDGRVLKLLNNMHPNGDFVEAQTL